MDEKAVRCKFVEFTQMNIAGHNLVKQDVVLLLSVFISSYVGV